MDPNTMAHIRFLACLNRISGYHRLSCGHVVRTPEGTPCHMNCKTHYQSLLEELAQPNAEQTPRDEAARGAPIIVCEDCARDKVFDSDILTFLAPALQGLRASFKFHFANEKDRAAMFANLYEELDLASRWHAATEREVQRIVARCNPIVGRPARRADDALANGFSQVGLNSTPAAGIKLYGEYMVEESGSKNVPMKDVLPPIRPLGEAVAEWKANELHVKANELYKQLGGMELEEEEEL